MDDVTICNMALSHIGKESISALSETSVEAEACNTHYANALDAALQAIDWNFARHRTTLALLTETPPEVWTYAYAYPSNCVRCLRIQHTERNPRVPYPFEVGLNAAADNKAIFCDVSGAKLVYTRRVTNPNLFDPLFVDAFSYRLASAIAIPLTRDVQLAQKMEGMFIMRSSLASAQSGNEGQKDDNPESEFVAVRR